VFLDYLACLAIADDLGFYYKNKDKKTRLLKKSSIAVVAEKLFFQ
jgi:hypothetical protein